MAVGKNVDAAIELYDLSTDPSEQKNVASKFPDVVKKLKEMMESAHRESKDWPLLVKEKLARSGNIRQ